MKRDITFFLLFSFTLIALPGFGRVIDWGKKSVDQGENIKKDLTKAKNHIVSSRIYDQFELVGSFDSLWLTDEVREAYADLYVLKRGRTEVEKKIFLRRQLEENNHFISFYMLSVADIVIGDKDSVWTVLLRIGDYNFMPTEFRSIELSSEYKSIFGKKFNRFKNAYIVRFNAKDIEDRSIIQPDTDTISLVFRTINKEAVQSWQIDKQGVVQKTIA